MDKLLQSMEEDIVIFEPYCKSKLNLVKIHVFTHYNLSTVLFEDPPSHSTDAGEHGHKSLTKTPWRQSNKRNEETQMLKSISKSSARMIIDKPQLSSQKKQRQENEIAGDPIYSGTFTRLANDDSWIEKIPALVHINPLMFELLGHYHYLDWKVCLFSDSL